MSRIVKAFEVVDDRHSVCAQLEDASAGLAARPVLKQGVLPGAAVQTAVLPKPHVYLDTLNRLKVRIDEAQAELRDLNRRIEEARGTLERPAQPEPVPQPQPASPTQREEWFGEEEPYHRFASKEEIRALVDTAQEEAQALRAQAEAVYREATDARQEAEALRQEAEALRRQAQDDAHAYREQAKVQAAEQAEAARSEGYLAGFNQGYEEAVAEFREKNQPYLQQFEQLLERLASFEEDAIRDYEDDLVRFVLAVAEKIIGEELAADPKKIVSMLYKTLDANRRHDWITVTVAPDLLPVSSKASAQVAKLIAEVAPGATLVVDKDAPPGTCMVETAAGCTDIGVPTQLQNLQTDLLEQD